MSKRKLAWRRRRRPVNDAAGRHWQPTNQQQQQLLPVGPSNLAAQRGPAAAHDQLAAAAPAPPPLPRCRCDCWCKAEIEQADRVVAAAGGENAGDLPGLGRLLVWAIILRLQNVLQATKQMVVMMVLSLPLIGRHSNAASDSCRTGARKIAAAKQQLAAVNWQRAAMAADDHPDDRWRLERNRHLCARAHHCVRLHIAGVVCPYRLTSHRQAEEATKMDSSSKATSIEAGTANSRRLALLACGN
jgi:hypothetical protein